jgi:hypothetical protein
MAKHPVTLAVRALRAAGVTFEPSGYGEAAKPDDRGGVDREAGEIVTTWSRPRPPGPRWRGRLGRDGPARATQVTQILARRAGTRREIAPQPEELT